MAAKRNKGAKKARAPERPLEIPMTDLEAEGETGSGGDSHAAGTPAGGTASGGLAGSNVGDGSPDNVDLENAMGSGIRDTAGEEEDGGPYAGRSGGAIGGTPARGRNKGGRTEYHGVPPKSRPGDSTVGSK
jgi:hypothetical protein